MNIVKLNPYANNQIAFTGGSSKKNALSTVQGKPGQELKPMPRLNGAYFGVKTSPARQVTFSGYNNLRYIGTPLLIDPEYVAEYERQSQEGFKPEATLYERKFEQTYTQYRQALSNTENAKPSQGAVNQMEKILLRNGIVRISGPVSDQMAEMVQEKVNILVAIMRRSGEAKPIRFLVNSPGGSILSMNSILDSMDYAKNTEIGGKKIPVATYCQGYAASAASVIMANGTPGYRSMSPRAEIMIHQPLGGASGQETDIAIAAKRIRQMKDEINAFFQKTTKMPKEMLTQVMERDFWMSSKDSKEYGFVDVVAPFEELDLSEGECGRITGTPEPKKDAQEAPEEDKTPKRKSADDKTE